VNKRRKLDLLALLGLVGVAIGFCALRTREPAYEGKRLSSWLEELNQAGSGQINSRAERAIRQIGTNALPFLVADLCDEDSPHKLALMEWYNKWSSRKIRFKTFADRRGPVLMAFYVLGNAGKLGPAAKPFLPSLGKLLDRQPDKAAFALMYIGAESTPYLTDALTHTNWLVRTWAAVALAKLNLEVPKRGLNSGTTLSLYSCQPVFWPFFSYSADDIPAFMTNLKSTNAVVRAATAEATIELQDPSWNRRLVPALLPLLRDDDLRVRNAASQALKRIVPEAATKAGVK
jgi:HEAT repeat protein